MSDPMEPINNLAKAASEALADLGLETQAFMLMPNPSGGPAMAQIVVTVSEDAAATVTETKPEDMTPEELEAFEEKQRVDAELEEMERAQAKFDADDAVAQAKEAAADLMRRLEGGASGGILDD